MPCYTPSGPASAVRGSNRQFLSEIKQFHLLGLSGPGKSRKLTKGYKNLVKVMSTTAYLDQFLFAEHGLTHSHTTTPFGAPGKQAF